MDHIYNNIHGWFNFPEMYNFILDNIPENFTFAEIGVWKGKSLSYFVVESINRQKTGKIFAIDHWNGSEEHITKNNQAYEKLLETENGLYNDFLSNIEPIKNYISIIRKSSIEASKNFADNTFDAIFIDGSHDYDNVKADINAWYPKLKKGTIISGHDYDGNWPGVVNAVNEFATKNNLIIHISGGSCWYAKT